MDILSTKRWIGVWQTVVPVGIRFLCFILPSIPYCHMNGACWKHTTGMVQPSWYKCVLLQHSWWKGWRDLFFLHSFGQSILAIWPLRTCGDWFPYTPVVILLRLTEAGIYSKPTNTHKIFSHCSLRTFIYLKQISGFCGDKAAGS